MAVQSKTVGTLFTGVEIRIVVTMTVITAAIATSLPSRNGQPGGLVNRSSLMPGV
jgi:hypothetical protein